MAAAPQLVPSVLPFPLSIHASAVAHAAGSPARRRPLRATDTIDHQRPTILLVEPDERSRSLIQAGLLREGFEVIAAASGEEALRFLSPDRPLPSMIFCEADLRNGNGDGFSLCGQVRADQRTADLPVVLLARSPESYHRELAGGAGADQYLPKPLYLNDVVALAKLMAGHSSSEARFEIDTDRLPLPQLLRALLSGVRAGRIELHTAGAFITFREGRVVDASCDGLRAEEALNRILLLKTGAYTVTFGPALTRATMTYGLEDLCRRTLPRIARWQRLQERSVPLEALLVVDFARLKDALPGLPDDVNAILRLFDGRRMVREVVLDASVDEVTALEVVTRLYAMAVLAPMPETQGTEELERELFSDLDASNPGERAVSLFEASGTLDAEMLRQLDAFRIKPVSDAPLMRVLDTPSAELEAFTQLEAEVPVAGLESAVSGHGVETAPALSDEPVTPVLETRRTVEPDAPSLEDSFFTQGDAEVTVETEVAAPSTGRRSWLTVSAVIAGLLIAGALGMAAWRSATGSAPAKGGPTAANARVQVAPTRPAAVRTMVPKVLPAAAVVPAAPASEIVEVADRSAQAVAKANALYDAHEYRGAISLLEEITAADPSVEQAWVLLGLARFDHGDRAGAEAAAMKALALDSKNGRAIVLLATVFLDKGQTREAKIELQRYLELYPTGPFAHEVRELLGR